MTKCNECGKLCTPSEMTDDCRMCKDCYIKWLEGQFKELKKDNEGYDKDNTLLVNRFNQTSAKLTKAKELLNEFMRISKASDEDFEHDYSELIGEAEQFLNSEVEK